jgi:hypothetical protein
MVPQVRMVDKPPVERTTGPHGAGERKSQPIIQPFDDRGGGHSFSRRRLMFRTLRSIRLVIVLSIDSARSANSALMVSLVRF